MLIIPLLAWNLLLGSRIIDQRITSDSHSPKGLLIAENIFRILVFALPLFIILPHGADWVSSLLKVSLAVYILGTLV